MQKRSRGSGLPRESWFAGRSSFKSRLHRTCANPEWLDALLHSARQNFPLHRHAVLAMIRRLRHIHCEAAELPAKRCPKIRRRFPDLGSLRVYNLMGLGRDIEPRAHRCRLDLYPIDLLICRSRTDGLPPVRLRSTLPSTAYVSRRATWLPTRFRSLRLEGQPSLQVQDFRLTADSANNRMTAICIVCAGAGPPRGGVWPAWLVNRQLAPRGYIRGGR
jgi:hypothetical protein